MIGQFRFTFDTSLLRQRLDTFADQVIPYIKKTFVQVAEWGLRNVKTYTPNTHSGTNIRDMWIMTESSEGTITNFIIRNTYKDPQIIRWFETGTKPHEIPVGECGFLHFFTYEGQEVYTKRPVWHPGTVPWRMVEQTTIEVGIKIDQYVQETFAMVDQMMGGE